MASQPSISNSITVRLEVPARGNAVSQLKSLLLGPDAVLVVPWIVVSESSVRANVQS